MKKNKNHEDAFKKAKKSSKNGLNISYDKKELEEYLPHLIDEISEKKKILRMDLVNFEIEEKEDEMDQINSSYIPKELINPGVIDFIRRCVTKDEAIEILEYCLKKKELGLKEYEKYKNQIMQKGGLKKLIEESGGLKHPGYYEKKYYKKDFNHQKFKSNEF
jgi:hypothetical protein